MVERLQQETRAAVFSAVVPRRLIGRPVEVDGHTLLESVQGVEVPRTWVLDRKERTAVTGWSFAHDIQASDPDTHAYFVLRSLNEDRSYFAPIQQRIHRDGVVRHLRNVDPRFTASAGFSSVLWCEEVAEGEYEFGVVHASEKKAAVSFIEQTVFVGAPNLEK